VARQEQVVVDSSVVVKWFSASEPDGDLAIHLRDEHVKGHRRLWASDLLFHEVANALRYKPQYNLEQLKEAVRALHAIHLHTGSTDERILERAVEIAVDANVTVYDAVPVALAELKQTVCITADSQTQYKKLKPKGYPVTLLSRQEHTLPPKTSRPENPKPERGMLPKLKPFEREKSDRFD